MGIETAKPVFLDTLETTSDCFLSKAHEAQYNSALRKGNTNIKLSLLVDATEDKAWKDRYWDAWHCRRVILQQGDKLKSSLCRRRWCQTCSRIKTAELLHAYKQPLLDLGALYFVTLSAPNVKENQLRPEIKKLIKGFQRIKDNMRKNYGMKINGMRKIEVTYSKKRNDYHPHFHLIMQGKEEAELLLKLWLSQFNSASNKGQNIKPVTANEKSFIELFKYASKDAVNDKTSAHASHIMNMALYTIRTIQTFGNIRKIKEPVEAKECLEIADYRQTTSDIWVWEDSCIDYVNASNDLLIGTLDIMQRIKPPS